MNRERRGSPFHFGMWRSLLVLGLITGCAAPTRMTVAPAQSSEPPAAPPSSPTVEATPPAPPTPPEPTGPAARELSDLPRQRVASPEGTFIAEVEGKAPPTLSRGEGVVRVTVPLGTSAPLVCFVYERPLDAASALLALADTVKKGPGVTVKHMGLTELVEVAHTPALFLDVDYEAPTKGGERGAGQLKLMVHADKDLPLLCAHDEPGYMRTFHRITTALAESLQVPGPRRPPEPWEEIQAVRLEGQLVGFVWRTRDDLPTLPASPHRTQSTTSLLWTTAEGDLRAEDTTTTALADAQGQLLEYRSAHAENGVLALQVTLRKDPKQGYKYEARQGAKSAQGSIATQRGLTAEPADLATRQLLAESSRDAERVLDVYRPEDSLAAAVQLTLRKDAPRGPRALTTTTHETTTRALVDASGHLQREEARTAQGLRASERLFPVEVSAP
ncbi:hypothetical protein KRR26_32070 [Corallococcus sp. M34]|nr:hypothetical protein [Citreicoccus inhibens]